MSGEILEGRLDPRTIPLRILERLGSFAIVLVALLLNDPKNLLPWLAILGVSTALSMLEYARTSYRLTPDALELTTGLLTRRVRRIPLDRIQDLGTEATPLRRALGVVTVTVETAGSAGAEARLDAVAPAAAEALRIALGARPGAPAAVERESVPLYAARPADLLLVGLTDNRAGVLVAGGLVLLERFGDLAGLHLEGLVERAVDYGSTLGPAGSPEPVTLVTGVATFALVLMMLGWGLSALLTYARFAGFRLEGVPSADGGVLRRRYGLFTTREGSLPRRRVQILRLEESPLRLLVRRVVLRAETAGSAGGKGAARAGQDVLAPATTREEAAALVPLVLPGATLPAHWNPVSTLLIRRSAFRGGLLALVAAGGALTADAPWPLLLGLPSLPALGALLGALAHRRLAWAVVGEHLAIRSGRLGRVRALVPRERVQAVRLSSTPFDRRAGVQTLRLHVVGGAQLRLGYLAEADAAALGEFLTHRAHLR